MLIGPAKLPSLAGSQEDPRRSLQSSSALQLPASSRSSKLVEQAYALACLTSVLHILHTPYFILHTSYFILHPLLFCANIGPPPLSCDDSPIVQSALYVHHPRSRSYALVLTDRGVDPSLPAQSTLY